MIVIDKLWPTYIKTQDFTKLQDYGIEVSACEKHHRNNSDIFFVSWGDPAYQVKGLTMETGFFEQALHFDRLGLYERASFNFEYGRKELFKAEFPHPWASIKPKLRSKFSQPKEQIEWDGVVVVGQHPTDRSILKAGTTSDYHTFLDRVCNHYKSRAFIKLHPVTVGNAKERETVEGIAKKHGSSVGHVGSSILKSCEAVWVYNSTYVVDALVEGRPVHQYAPGYFWQTGVVDFTGREVSRVNPKNDVCATEQFLSFLVWRYCFHSKLALAKIAEMLKEASLSNSLFPVQEKYSYASYLLNETN